jgi:hypothetical protein
MKIDNKEIRETINLQGTEPLEEIEYPTKNKTKANQQKLLKTVLADLESTKSSKTKNQNTNKRVVLEESNTNDMIKGSRKGVNSKQFLKRFQQSHHQVLHNPSSRRRNQSKTSLIYRRIIQARN